MVKTRFPKIRPVLEGPIIISVTAYSGPYPLSVETTKLVRKV